MVCRISNHMKIIKSITTWQFQPVAIHLLKLKEPCNTKKNGRHQLSTDAGSSTNTIKSNPIRNISLFLKLHAGTIRNRMWGLFTSPIRNTSFFLRPHVGTIHKYNQKHLLVFEAPHGDNPQVQSGTPSCF